MLLFAAKKSTFDIDYINKLPIFELIPLLRILKTKE